MHSLIKNFIVTQSSSSYASFEDVSTSGTVVLRSQYNDSDSPQTPRSRLGLNSRNSNASLEDSATNLAEVLFIFYLSCEFHLYANCGQDKLVFLFAVCRVSVIFFNGGTVNNIFIVPFTYFTSYPYILSTFKVYWFLEPHLKYFLFNYFLFFCMLIYIFTIGGLTCL